MLEGLSKLLAEHLGADSMLVQLVRSEAAWIFVLQFVFILLGLRDSGSIWRLKQRLDRALKLRDLGEELPEMSEQDPVRQMVEELDQARMQASENLFGRAQPEDFLGAFYRRTERIDANVRIYGNACILIGLMGTLYSFYAAFAARSNNELPTVPEMALLFVPSLCGVASLVLLDVGFRRFLTLPVTHHMEDALIAQLKPRMAASERESRNQLTADLGNGLREGLTAIVDRLEPLFGQQVQNQFKALADVEERMTASLEKQQVAFETIGASMLKDQAELQTRLLKNQEELQNRHDVFAQGLLNEIHGVRQTLFGKDGAVSRMGEAVGQFGNQLDVFQQTALPPLTQAILNLGTSETALVQQINEFRLGLESSLDLHNRWIYKYEDELKLIGKQLVDSLNRGQQDSFHYFAQQLNEVADKWRTHQGVFLSELHKVPAAFVSAGMRLQGASEEGANRMLTATDESVMAIRRSGEGVANELQRALQPIHGQQVRLHEILQSEADLLQRWSELLAEMAELSEKMSSPWLEKALIGIESLHQPMHETAMGLDRIPRLIKILLDGAAEPQSIAVSMQHTP